MIAFLLSFLPPARSPAGQRAKWTVSYLGLPLLYFAYNSFETLHDWIMQGFSLVRGGGPSSPFDPTDSIVIPFAIAIALWVWRRGSNIDSRHTMRFRTALIVAIAASFATVATTSEDTPVAGIIALGTGEDGATLFAYDDTTVHAAERDGRWVTGGFPLYSSGDGGLSWHETEGFHRSYPVQTEITSTPQGIYAIEGSNITRDVDGKSETVYSSIAVSEDADFIALDAATRSLGARQVNLEPASIYYHEHSGNLIVAMGLRGVVVKTPDGTWMPVNVGEFKPVDLSFAGKLDTLLDWQLGLMAFAISISFTAFVTTLPAHRSDTTSKRAFSFTVGAVILCPALVTLVLSTVPESLLLLSYVGIFLVTALSLAMLVPKILNSVNTHSKSRAEIENINHADADMVSRVQVNTLLELSRFSSFVPLPLFSRIKVGKVAQERGSEVMLSSLAIASAVGANQFFTANAYLAVPTLPFIFSMGGSVFAIFVAVIAIFTGHPSTKALPYLITLFLLIFAITHFIWIGGDIELSVARISATALIALGRVNTSVWICATLSAWKSQNLNTNA